jgi:hypothetical protein
MVASRSIHLYRAISVAEANDLFGCRVFRASPQGIESGKWFAMTNEHAIAWARLFELAFGERGHKVVEIDLPEEIYNRSVVFPRLDGIGPAIFVEMSDLVRVPFREVT